MCKDEGVKNAKEERRYKVGQKRRGTNWTAGKKVVQKRMGTNCTAGEEVHGSAKTLRYKLHRRGRATTICLHARVHTAQPASR